MSYKVLLTDAIAEEPFCRISEMAEVVVAPDNRPETLTSAASDADVIVVRSPLPAGLFDQAPRLRGVVRHGAGIDMIPLETANHHGVAVANVPGANAVTVAEFALGQMLNLARLLSDADRTMREAGWAATKALADNTIELRGKRLGIVGIGDIGQALAGMAHYGLQMSIAAYRPSMAPAADYIEMLPLPELFAQSDFIVIACPLTDETRGMVSRDLIARMKKHAMLVNISRGPVIDEPALIDALYSKSIRAAALDVYTTQPLPADSPLLKLDNVLLSGHIAGMTQESVMRIGHKVADQVLQLLQGKLPEHLCNTQALTAIEARWQQLI